MLDEVMQILTRILEALRSIPVDKPIKLMFFLVILSPSGILSEIKSKTAS